MWRREMHRERKMAYVRELLTYCFLALLQCLGRDVGAINGFCSNVIIWFFRKMKKLYFGSDLFWFVPCGWCLEVWMLVSNIGDNYRVENSGQAQFVMFQFQASLTLIPLFRLVLLHICYLLSLSALSVDYETTNLFSGLVASGLIGTKVCCCLTKGFL
jgi:hypothetical protein